MRIIKDKPVANIAIPGWKTGDNSFGSSLPYLQFMSAYGSTRILAINEDIDPSIDLIVIPGGPDVDTRRYNEPPEWYTSKPDPVKEYFDTQILPKYIELGISVFGICRGCQSIGVLYGAKLVQHMYHETNEKSRFEKVHEIELVSNDFKHKYYTENTKRLIKVNSLHHQCISDENFPEDQLEVIARYQGKIMYEKSIEAIQHRTLPIYAVQYHPEELIEDDLSDFMIIDLLKRTKGGIYADLY